jgi:hypothetical protein
MKRLPTALALTFAAALWPAVAAPKDVAPDTLITLQRGACEKRCAVYRVVIFADGTVIYEGRHFVRKTGLIKGGVSQEALARLVDELESGGFFQLDADYGHSQTAHCDRMDSDGPAAILSVASRGQAKTVLHSHRCVGAASDRLTMFEDMVDRAVGSAKWIR